MTHIATETQTDRIVRLALRSGKYRRERDEALAACAGCPTCEAKRVAAEARGEYERAMAERVAAQQGATS